MMQQDPKQSTQIPDSVSAQIDADAEEYRDSESAPVAPVSNSISDSDSYWQPKHEADEESLRVPNVQKAALRKLRQMKQMEAAQSDDEDDTSLEDYAVSQAKVEQKLLSEATSGTEHISGKEEESSHRTLGQSNSLSQTFKAKNSEVPDQSAEDGLRSLAQAFKAKKVEDDKTETPDESDDDDDFEAKMNIEIANFEKQMGDDTMDSQVSHANCGSSEHSMPDFVYTRLRFALLQVSDDGDAVTSTVEVDTTPTIPELNVNEPEAQGVEDDLKKHVDKIDAMLAKEHAEEKAHLMAKHNIAHEHLRDNIVSNVQKKDAMIVAKVYKNHAVSLEANAVNTKVEAARAKESVEKIKVGKLRASVKILKRRNAEARQRISSSKTEEALVGKVNSLTSTLATLKKCVS